MPGHLERRQAHPPVSRSELTRAVRAAARGERVLAPVAERPIDRARGGAGDAFCAGEIEVLQLAARGLSNSEIAQELFVSTIVTGHFTHI